MGSSKKGSTIKSQIVEDPYKTKVSSPLSNFLASEVGKGLPSYTATTGKSLYEKIDPLAYNKYQEFLNINPDEWYEKAVVKPTMDDMKEQYDYLSEGWAGSLRGSGRFRDLEDFTQDTAETLAEGRYKAELEIPQAQFGMAQAYQNQVNKEKLLDYTDWFQSLPENNPVLEKSLQFLNADSGWNLVSWQEQGKSSKNSLWGTVGGIGLMAALALATGGTGAAFLPGVLGSMTGGQLALAGGVAGGLTGSLFD